MKKYLLTISFALMLTILNLACIFVPNTNTVSAEQDYTIKTISEIGNPTIAGTGSYYDDGMLCYANTGSTIGYNIDHSDTVFEFDIIFDTLAWPAWFSLNLKVDGFDRTQSANLNQKGYSFVFFPSGQIQVWKPDMETIVTSYNPFVTGVKHRIKIGAINQENGVLLTLNIDGTQVINQVDSTNAYLIGNWFNICSDGGVTARLFSTKKEVFPNYYTYTLSTIGEYPTRVEQNPAIVDKYNNIIIENGQLIGFGQYLKNMSLEVNINWSRFVAGSNLWIATRVGGFDRANSSNLSCKGYSIRLASMGVVDIYKDGTHVSSVGYGFALDTDYIVEIGTVDLDSKRTQIFVLINNQAVLSYMDDNNPIQRSGMLTINGDGNLKCNISSVSTKLTPLMTKVKENTDSINLETYFNNTISYTNMEYSDFSDILLDAILVNNTSLKDINNAYYALDNENKINAIDANYIDNRLILTINKNLYVKSTDVKVDTFEFEELTLKKTSINGGMQCPSGFVLKQTYYFSV